jgi:hypothetical protein
MEEFFPLYRGDVVAVENYRRLLAFLHERDVLLEKKLVSEWQRLGTPSGDEMTVRRLFVHFAGEYARRTSEKVREIEYIYRPMVMRERDLEAEAERLIAADRRIALLERQHETDQDRIALLRESVKESIQLPTIVDECAQLRERNRELEKKLAARPPFAPYEVLALELALDEAEARLVHAEQTTRALAEAEARLHEEGLAELQVKQLRQQLQEVLQEHGSITQATIDCIERREELEEENRVLRRSVLEKEACCEENQEALKASRAYTQHLAAMMEYSIASQEKRESQTQLDLAHYRQQLRETKEENLRLRQRVMREERPQDALKRLMQKEAAIQQELRETELAYYESLEKLQKIEAYPVYLVDEDRELSFSGTNMAHWLREGHNVLVVDEESLRNPPRPQAQCSIQAFLCSQCQKTSRSCWEHTSGLKFCGLRCAARYRK